MTVVGRVIEKFRQKVSEMQKGRLYGKFWNESVGPEWYFGTFDVKMGMHQAFIDYLNERRLPGMDILEVGCGAGMYPIKKSELFEGVVYTGIDISKPVIKYCRRYGRENRRFLHGDFLKYDFKEKFEMVFSHRVIDHVYDIDRFVERCVDLSRRYVYISAYNGYFEELLDHKMKWSRIDNCYYNNLSVSALDKMLCRRGLWGKFDIIKQSTGSDKEPFATVIMIDKG